ncbi:hypothetical protein [Engelhardtia mirabilis]|uniref:Uncharacterized protein n=1 Tax=Engelhardtia mirabilis TaxID=2528011 RepID=A0A518BFR7_9BACT|nr:hypothetical protein Pla133_08900 [Planctomycetes bacterium Pla133]QDV00150.1 hypothetical protein Pla86_08890 [Planctomycetes bacterium Pla86]
MDRKQIDVECPSCNSRLAVDVLTATVVRWAAAPEAGAMGPGTAGTPKLTEADWSAAMSRMSSRKERSGEAFEAAFSKEQERTRDLDDLFDRAAQRAGAKENQREEAWDRTNPTKALPAEGQRARWRIEEAAGSGDRRVLSLLSADPTAHGDEVELAVLPGAEALAAELIEAGFRPVEVACTWWAPVDPGAAEASGGLQPRTDPGGEVAVLEGLPLPSPAAKSVAQRAERARAAAGALGARRIALRGLAVGAQEDELAACGFSISHHVQRWRRR